MCPVHLCQKTLNQIYFFVSLEIKLIVKHILPLFMSLHLFFYPRVSCPSMLNIVVWLMFQPLVTLSVEADPFTRRPFGGPNTLGRARHNTFVADILLFFGDPSDTPQ